MLILFYRGWEGLLSVGKRLTSGNWVVVSYTLLSAGGTVFYFFVSLIICLVVAFVMHGSNLVIKWIGFFVSTIMLFYLRDLSETLNLPFLAIYSSPLNFFPYIFIAILLSAYKAQIAQFGSAILAISSLLYVGLCAFEWQFVILQPNPTVFNDWMPGYSRISLVFGVIF
jgi:hypothetical protein